MSATLSYDVLDFGKCQAVHGREAQLGPENIERLKEEVSVFIEQSVGRTPRQ